MQNFINKIKTIIKDLLFEEEEIKRTSPETIISKNKKFNSNVKPTVNIKDEKEDDDTNEKSIKQEVITNDTPVAKEEIKEISDLELPDIDESEDDDDDDDDDDLKLPDLDDLDLSDLPDLKMPTETENESGELDAMDLDDDLKLPDLPDLDDLDLGDDDLDLPDLEGKELDDEIDRRIKELEAKIKASEEASDK